MQRELLHIYGPFSVYSYGAAIAIGLIAVVWLINRHPMFTTLKLKDHFSSIIIVSVLSGIFGGRLWYALSEPNSISGLGDFFAYWHGGLSLLGGIIGISIALSLWLKRCNIPILPFLDLTAIYAPLLQAISRIGCLCAGCCYGLPTNLPWAILYSDPQSAAPIGVYIHPTQLYSSLVLLGIFLLMYFFLQHVLTKSGQLFTLYLMLAGTERFIVDFLRADRTFMHNTFLSILSINQWVALGITLSAGIAFYIITLHDKEAH